MDASRSLEQVLRGYTAPSAEELCRPVGDGRLECLACGHRCRIAEGHAGVCRVRHVEGGRLLRPHGYVAGLACDPIEKKPFYHVFPGRDALTFGMLGCDLHCDYCQNWETSQVLRDEEAISGFLAVSAAEIASAASEEGARIVVSSYNEPLITADWAVEVFRLARARGLLCAFVSNGNATPEVLAYLRPLVDAYKVDLKGFRDSTYRSLGGKLSTVLETIRELRRTGYWVEVVTLVVPGLNDDPAEFRDMARFLAEVDPSIPWHVTAFHPDYRMTDRGRTAARQLIEAHDIGRAAGLRFVYTGNMPGVTGDREDTLCPGCGATILRRRGFVVLENRMRGGACPDCGVEVPGLWEKEPPQASTGSGMPRRVRVGRPVFC
jgi:pyruvate formate lyase activating enzyme